MPRVRFDGTINAGHVLTILSIVGSVFIAYMNIVRTMDEHELRLTTVEKQVDNSEAFQRQLLATLGLIREDIATLKERSKKP
ncbi:MAG: hypothetical protein WA973_12755 [Mesorhizobium sp.]